MKGQRSFMMGNVIFLQQTIAQNLSDGSMEEDDENGVKKALLEGIVNNINGGGSMMS